MYTAGNPVILKDPDGRIIKASNEEGKEAIHNMLSYFEKFSTSNTKKYKDVETLFALHPDNTLFSSRDIECMSFHKFKKRASEHFDFKKHIIDVDINNKILKVENTIPILEAS
jgi:hypothetical protein